MIQERTNNIEKCAFIMLICTLSLFHPAIGHAYIDPGTTGLVSQILYVLFYGVIGVFLYYLRGIKTRIALITRIISKRFSHRS
jgi:hypothetical protein